MKCGGRRAWLDIPKKRSHMPPDGAKIRKPTSFGKSRKNDSEAIYAAFTDGCLI
jgi:hypothetical protein